VAHSESARASATAGHHQHQLKPIDEGLEAGSADDVEAHVTTLVTLVTRVIGH
jgi:hypothetical protein